MNYTKVQTQGYLECTKQTEIYQDQSIEYKHISKLEDVFTVRTSVCESRTEGLEIELSLWKECLVCKRPWAPSLALHKPGIVECPFPSTGEGDARRSGVQGLPQLHSEFKANLGYMSQKNHNRC